MVLKRLLSRGIVPFLVLLAYIIVPNDGLLIAVVASFATSLADLFMRYVDVFIMSIIMGISLVILLSIRTGFDVRYICCGVVATIMGIIGYFIKNKIKSNHQIIDEDLIHFTATLIVAGVTIGTWCIF